MASLACQKQAHNTVQSTQPCKQVTPLRACLACFSPRRLCTTTGICLRIGSFHVRTDQRTISDDAITVQPRTNMYRQTQGFANDPHAARHVAHCYCHCSPCLLAIGSVSCVHRLSLHGHMPAVGAYPQSINQPTYQNVN